MRILIAFACLSIMSACIGTDLVDVPLGPSASKAEIQEDQLSLLTDEDHQLNYRLLANDGSEVEADTWDWTSRSVAIATVSEAGVVTARSTGQTWVVGTANKTFEDSVLVTVLNDPNAVASVEVEGSGEAVAPGATIQLTAQAKNLSGDVVTSEISWSSDNGSVATVDQSGLVTASTVGTAGIIASSEGISSVPFQITVEDEGGVTRSGAFEGRNGYDAEGTAMLTIAGDASTLEFLADFKTQSGPGLYIYLSPSGSNVDGGINLGEIQSTRGQQLYEIPASANLEGMDHVIIYCKPFGVLFGSATFED